MDPNIKERPAKPKIRPITASHGGCSGCDLFGKSTLCRGSGPGTPCVMPDRLLHFKIVGEHPSTR